MLLKLLVGYRKKVEEMTSNQSTNGSTDHLDDGNTSTAPAPAVASVTASKPRRKLRRSSDKPKSQWKPKFPRPKNMTRTEYYAYLAARRAENPSDNVSSAACASVWRTKKNPKLVVKKSNCAVKERQCWSDSEGNNGNEDSEASSNN